MKDLHIFVRFIPKYSIVLALWNSPVEIPRPPQSPRLGACSTLLRASLIHALQRFYLLAVEETEGRYGLCWVWGGNGVAPYRVKNPPLRSGLPQYLVLLMPEPCLSSRGSSCWHLDLPFFPYTKWFPVTQCVFHFVNVGQDYRCFLVSSNVKFVSVFDFFVLYQKSSAVTL